LALESGVALDLLDHLGDAPAVLLGREVRPAGEGLEMHRVRGRKVQALEGDAPTPSDVLPGTVEIAAALVGRRPVGASVPGSL
jgi:hypothetical protein